MEQSFTAGTAHATNLRPALVPGWMPGAGCLAALAMSPRGRAHPRHVELARGGALAVRAGVRAALGALLGRGRGTHPLQVAPGDSG